MSEGDPSRIINIGSVDGLRVPSMETFAYSSSKAGLHHLSRVLANHLGKRNITYVLRRRRGLVALGASDFSTGASVKYRCNIC